MVPAVVARNDHSVLASRRRPRRHGDVIGADPDGSRPSRVVARPFEMPVQAEQRHRQRRNLCLPLAASLVPLGLPHPPGMPGRPAFAHVPFWAHRDEARVCKRVSERDLNPCSCELRFYPSLREERQITAGQVRVYVSEGDLNPEAREISPIRGNFHGPSITADARRRQAFHIPSGFPGRAAGDVRGGALRGRSDAARRSRSVMSAESGQAEYPPLARSAGAGRRAFTARKSG
jgi:hypothetical protein